jgi:hypothetical protein
MDCQYPSWAGAKTLGAFSGPIFFVRRMSASADDVIWGASPGLHQDNAVALVQMEAAADRPCPCEQNQNCDSLVTLSAFPALHLL